MNKLLESESFHLTNKSGNFKTGKMAVSTSSRKTCDAKACPFHKDNGGGCYAEEGYHLRMHWDKVTSGERGLKWNLFLEQLKKLKKGSFVINASTENLKTADKRLEQGLQTVSVISSNDPRIEKYKGSDNKTYWKQKEEIKTPKGVKGVICPAQRFENEKINCKNCKLCSKVRDYPIIFIAHGTGVKKANQALNH